ncbi:hypothetical protein CBR_g38110 [Chara braunii]|uniref:Myb-like domain-containing protein n=1 Tax=Chara braunii TaxID=69332 RepID=A0A388LP56_CHABU|nr:hypothetical protein CBR_g38110 [Chara braunii]|eukprot:GBG84136.1 hypothetical protein CBR_g38110 [Chara braunii]
MQAHSDGGDDDGGGGDNADERLMEDVEAGDDNDDIHIRPLGKTGGRGRGRSRGAVRGRSIGRGGRGGGDDDGGKSATYWSPEDQMLLVRCKRKQDMHLVGFGHNYGRMRTKEWKWDDIAKRMANAGRPRDADDCMKKWDNLFQNYKKIQRFQNASGQPDFFRLSNEERKEHNFKFRMERVLYNEIHAGMVGNHTIFPPNVADTGSPDGVQVPRQGAGGGESVGSEAGGEGFPEERSSARDSDNNAGSGAGGGKRKNARQQALEWIADVMDLHGELMSSTVESSSKRQCSIFTRQYDILEKEVAVQKAHYAASDETQRMMCHMPMEIAAAIREKCCMLATDKCRLLPADIFNVVEDRRRHHSSHLVTWTIFAGVVVLLACTWTSVVNRWWSRSTVTVGLLFFSPPIFSPRSTLAGVVVLLSTACTSSSSSRGGQYFCVVRVFVRVMPRQHGRHFSRQISGTSNGGRRNTSRSSDRTAKLARRSMPTRGSARGKKRDGVPHDSQGQGRGRRHVPKVKRVRSDDASARVPPRGAQGWAAAVGGDYDKDFTTEEEQGEASASAVRESGRQRSSDHSAPKRMLTPPPEAQQLCARKRRREKAAIVDLGCDDDDPLEKRRLRTRTTTTPPPAVVACSAVDERPVTGRLPATPSQPRQPNPGDDGGSVQHGGGGEVVADARKVGGESAGAAGAGALGTVAPVATAREEAALVFKSGNCPRGYNVAFQYSLESVATDIARAMWYGEEWYNVVSPTVCAHTIDLSMDLPLWFSGTNIEERPDGDDMVAHQDSTVIYVAHAFRAAVQMGALIDGDFISYDPLCRVADCFRLLLEACMWIMRMAGDDPRSHYEAFYFASLMAKPTLIAAMHRSFDHRRSVVHAANIVTEWLGKANATLGEYPDYIPQWAPCGIGFRHNASTTGPEDAKKLDWLGSAPLDDDNNDDGKYDA